MVYIFYSGRYNRRAFKKIGMIQRLSYGGNNKEKEVIMVTLYILTRAYLPTAQGTGYGPRVCADGPRHETSPALKAD